MLWEVLVKKGIHPIELGVLTNVDIKESEEYTYFSFVPAESAEYVFYSLSDEDTYGYLYDADFEQLYSNDDGGENRNFKITKYLDAGTQYFFGAKFYGQETGSFTVRLIKYIDNELNASAKNSEIHVAPGENAEMEVEATTDAGSITYKWYDDEWSEIEGANEAVYIANNITYYSEYYCRVSDEYGNSITVEFAVKIDNGITAEAKNAEITVAPGENAEMEVEATTDAGSITYQWYYTGDEIEGANEAIYVANNITYRSEYSCRVSDEYGNGTTVKFTVKIDNGFTAKAKNYQITVAPGDSATLEVEAQCTYGELYYEWREYHTRIEGATGTAYLLENIMEGTPLINCLVSDEYGNYIEVSFDIYVKNELNAHAVTESLRIAPGESATMEVNATCKKGAITYQWFDREDNIIEGEVEPIYTVEKVNKSVWYRCLVRDEYGSYKNVYFTVYVENGFTAKAVPSSTIKVAPGETAVMKVGASCTLGKISYQWYDAHDTLIKGATKASYSVEAVNRRSTYYCRASDEYGNSSTIYFSVRMDTGFAYEAASDTFFAVSRGDSIDLSVKAQNKYGNINYSWERRSGNTTQWTPLEGETAASYTTPGVEENCFYRCTIKNEYGESGIVSFEIHIVSEGIKPIELDTDTDAVISAGGEYAFFSFVPSETDFYSFYSTADQDTYGYLYDSNFKQITSDDDSGTDSNFEIVRKLEAGKQYYYGVRFFRDWTTGSFTVRLEHRAVFGSGQSSDGLFWRFEEGVLTISGTGSNWYELQAGYNAYRGDITKVVVEEGVTSLGSYAFGKCPKLQEAELPDSLFSIGSYAFTECPALTAVTIPVGVNYIYDMAFSACSGLKEITFKGDAPTFYWGEMGGYSQFTGVTANANYPAMNKTWIEGVRGDYGGTLTWKPDGFLEGSVKASDINLKVNTKKSQSAQIKVTENVSEGALTYRSDNEKVAVDAKGKVTVEAGFTGFATITIESAATDTYIEAFTTITVNVLFSDVTDPETQFYYDYVYWAANSGITTGYNDGSFGPLKDCNRAAVVTFLWRMAGKPEPGSMATFKDMTNNPDFDKAISWALENGITTGYEKDNTFRPWNPCNRAAIVTFLWRYAGSPEPKTMATFNDMTNNKDFDKAISWAAENGITTGYEKDNTFRPWNTCNRLAVVSFLARYDAL